MSTLSNTHTDSLTWPTKLEAMPVELLCEVRSNIADLFTHVSLSQTCRIFRAFYDDADTAKNRPSFFETSCRKLGVGRSTNLHIKEGGSMPDWRSLAAAIARHSAKCDVPDCKDVAQKDLRELTVAAVVTPEVAFAERTILYFAQTLNNMSMVNYSNPSDASIPVDSKYSDITPLTNHISTASLFASFPPTSSLLIKVDGIPRSSIRGRFTKQNDEGLTCFDVIQGLCDILGVPFEASQREAFITDDIKEHYTWMSAVEVRKMYEEAKKVYQAVRHGAPYSPTI